MVQSWSRTRGVPDSTSTDPSADLHTGYSRPNLHQYHPRSQRRPRHFRRFRQSSSRRPDFTALRVGTNTTLNPYLDILDFSTATQALCKDSNNPCLQGNTIADTDTLTPISSMFPSLSASDLSTT